VNKAVKWGGGSVDGLKPQKYGDDSELCTSAIFFSAFWHCILCFLSKVKDNNTNKTSRKNNGGISSSIIRVSIGWWWW
jgi:hypothetical protein